MPRVIAALPLATEEGGAAAKEEGGSFLLTTNRGFFRVDTESDEVSRVKGTIEAGGDKATLGTFLELNLDPHQVTQAENQLKAVNGTVDARLPEVAAALRDDAAFACDFLQNLTAVDWPKRGEVMTPEKPIGFTVFRMLLPLTNT